MLSSDETMPSIPTTARLLLPAALLLALPAVAASPTINLDVKDADLRAVLGALARHRNKNLVIADGVAGRVTLRLHGVPWRAALDALLRAEGLGAEESEAILFIDTEERIIARTQRLAERRALDESNAELVTVVIPVNHANAESLRALLVPHLSRRGRITVDPRTNTLIITDVVRRDG